MNSTSGLNSSSVTLNFTFLDYITMHSNSTYYYSRELDPLDDFIAIFGDDKLALATPPRERNRSSSIACTAMDENLRICNS
jgi:hypothetical protein